MRFARPWLTTLGLLLLAGGLLAAPCSSLARCCGVMEPGPADHTKHSAEAVAQHTSSEGTAETASHCAVSQSSESTEPLFGLSPLNRGCSSKCGPSLLPVSGKRSLKAASRATALRVATAVSPSPGVETEEFGDRHRDRCGAGALFELHCALLI